VALNAADAAYVIVGIAVAAHGVMRENLQRLARALTDLGAHER
jgi:hypothetical protein